MRNTSQLYKALSDPNRLRILMMLKVKPLCVCEIVAVLGLANSTVSKHLSILRNTNLIMDEKSGRWVNYRLATHDESTDIASVMTDLKRQLATEKQVLLDLKKLETTDRFQLCSITE